MYASRLFLTITICLIAATAAAAPSFLFLLADDMGWSDFGYNNGIVKTPNIDAFANAESSFKLLDFHSGGTVCSPTRATVLTGRNHVRDCVYYVYGCADPTLCHANMPFGGPDPKVFTVADAVRAANSNYKSAIFGKWHLGDFWDDASIKYPSSPIVHGFDHFNMTLEVAPTATTNCNCKKEWKADCMLGHYAPTPHDYRLRDCCNYWWEDNSAPEKVNNFTLPVGKNDAEYLVDSFENFVNSRNGEPFLALVWFHNNHIPYIATDEYREECSSGKTCPPGNYSSAQLDFYGSTVELDLQIGRIRDILKKTGYYENTMTWFTADNGPEGNCPNGRCDEAHYKSYPGSAKGLRGRKRDTWEGGHRVAGIVEWPAQIKAHKDITNVPVNTIDFLPTVMDILKVDRPQDQRDWAMDGTSIMPLIRGEEFAERGMGWWWHGRVGTGWRFGKWKLVNDSKSCSGDQCKPMLFDLDTDLEETTDLSAKYPEIFQQMMGNLTEWVNSLYHSTKYESKCPTQPSQYPQMPDII